MAHDHLGRMIREYCLKWSFFVWICSAGDWTQGLECASQILYHWATWVVGSLRAHFGTDWVLVSVFKILHIIMHMKIYIWESTSLLEAQIWKLVAWNSHLNLQSSSPREMIRKWEMSRVSLVNHEVRHYENGESSIWVCFSGKARTFLVPTLSEQRVSCSRAQISVCEYSLKLEFPSSLSG
jgi:hypothetical protein